MGDAGHAAAPTTHGSGAVTLAHAGAQDASPYYSWAICDVVLRSGTAHLARSKRHAPRHLRLVLFMGQRPPAGIPEATT